MPGLRADAGRPDRSRGGATARISSGGPIIAPERLVIVRPGIPLDAPVPPPPAAASDLGRAHVRNGWALVRERDYAGARAEFDRAIAVDDRSAQAFYWRAVAIASAGSKASALFDARRATSLDDGLLPARVLAGALASDLGRPDEALRELGAVIARNPAHGGGVAETLRAVVRIKSGDFGAALADARSACQRGSADGCRLGEILGRSPGAVGAGDRFKILGWSEVP